MREAILPQGGNGPFERCRIHHLGQGDSQSEGHSVLFFAGCGDSMKGDPVIDAPPETQVTATPPVLSETDYTVSFFWTGFDPDGSVRGYQWRISDNGDDGIVDVTDTLEYHRRADVWPLNPEGELFAVAMIESGEAIRNIKEILEASHHGKLQKRAVLVP